MDNRSLTKIKGLLIKQRLSNILFHIKANFALFITCTIILVTTLSLINIWWYLYFIGRLDLFPLAFTLKNIVQSVIFFAVVLAIIGTIFIFSIHNLWIIITITKWIPKEFLDYKKRIICLPLIPLFILLLFLLGVILIPSSPYINNNLIIFLLCLDSSIMLYILIFIDASTQLSKKNITLHITLYFIFAFSVLWLCYLLLLVFNFIDEKINITIFVLYLMLICFISFIPTFFYLATYISKNKLESLQKTLFTLIVTTCIFIYSCMFLLPNLVTYISFLSLNITGIASSQEHSYLIKSNYYHFNDFNKNIWDTTEASPNKIYIKGINAFSIGDHKLICPHSFLKLKKKALQNTFDFLIPTRNTEYIANFKTHNKQCLLFKQDEIMQWDVLAIEPPKHSAIQRKNKLFI